MKNRNEFEILPGDVRYEDIETLYGYSEFVITLDDLNALLNGKKLYATINDEYAFTIRMKKASDFEKKGEQDCEQHNFKK